MFRFVRLGFFLPVAAALLVGSIQSAMAEGLTGDVPSTVVSEQEFPSQKDDGVTVLSSRQLRPQADSPLILESFFLDEMSDGSKVVRGSVFTAGVTSQRRIKWAVDPSNGTYSAEESPIDEPLAAVGRGDLKIRPMEAGDPPPVCGAPDGPQPCDNPCSGSWTAMVETLEPVSHLPLIYEPLTRVTVSGFWSNAGANGCTFRQSYNGSCWATPLSFAYTTWYKDSCLRYFDTQSGAFHNDDFGWDHLRTYATTAVKINRTSIGVFVKWSANYSGEWWPALYGQMTESGSNTCFGI